MPIHHFDWRDFPRLYRYRHSSVFLDSNLVLTRGPRLMPGALFSYLMPSMGVFTYVSDGKGEASLPLIGQITHPSGSQYAHLTFLAPEAALESPGLSFLLETLAVIARERGAFRLLADVNEQTVAFDALHNAGFATYTRQRIWQFTAKSVADEHKTAWRAARSQDTIAIRSLYNALVPALVQQAEPFSMQVPQGLVYQQGDDLLAYVELKYGQRGIWVQPFVHPDAVDVPNRIGDLVRNLPYRYSRPVYICVRSYQAWLEPAIEELGAESGPRQAVMVKHLAAAQKALRSYTMPALEGSQPEISAPIAHLDGNSHSIMTTPQNETHTME